MRKLYSLLVNKQYEGIVPRIVAEAMSSLEKEIDHDISERVIESQKELEKKEMELKKMLEDIKKLIIPKKTGVSVSFNVNIPPTQNSVLLAPHEKLTLLYAPIDFHFS